MVTILHLAHLASSLKVAEHRTHLKAQMSRLNTSNGCLNVATFEVSRCEMTAPDLEDLRGFATFHYIRSTFRAPT